MGSIEEIASEFGELDFDEGAKGATARGLTLLSELTRSIFLPGRRPQPRELWGLAITISDLQRDLPRGKYAKSEITFDGLLDHLMAREDQNGLFGDISPNRLSRLTGADFLQLVHELKPWLSGKNCGPSTSVLDSHIKIVAETDTRVLE
jgi:hypothetical protein